MFLVQPWFGLGDFGFLYKFNLKILKSFIFFFDSESKSEELVHYFGGSPFISFTLVLIFLSLVSSLEKPCILHQKILKLTEFWGWSISNSCFSCLFSFYYRFAREKSFGWN